MTNQPTVRFESTPNPQTLRFSVERQLTETPVEFKTAAEAQFSPLAKKLFGFPWAAGVYVGRDFVTVTKQNWVDWEIIAEPLAGLIEEHLESGQPVVAPRSSSGAGMSSAGSLGRSPAEVDPNDSPQVAEIKRVLNEEIRPMVAQDGGDVTFAKYENGVVYVNMQGSCAGCPSSTMTLKMGIESRLKDAVPEIVEVIAL